MNKPANHDAAAPPKAHTAARTNKADRQELIREAAFAHAERRGFAPGHELDDWLAAETEVDQRLFGEGRVF
ncbi:MAG TPA: DUF2934 domain-containing protein [Steroidobacteraceae bacterium]|nr:DUF2934 domain-containing protein [Steroidobacteraceae bacterium]